ncbi:glycoside hydrolase family 16 protein [Durotheca rogersii]|uniref:glycoside hydrolase family 16 protein n=1 Tax=Durotheca rogersii TaxID=419775 RepID=UPI002220E2CD|nr:glycoside hydrolase family 16 protein [Durotheca rogersii]KAI5866112.1 glycoside hydrolase family 16 protein [Durotheca rogersii]
MFSKFLSAASVVLAASQLVSAQTFTECNPTEKKCPDEPALGGTINVDFTQGANDFFTLADGTKLTYDDNGAVFTINKETQAPTISSKKYIFFGKIDLVVRASTGVGVVTSFVLQSANLDEIDWEWLGGDTTQVQTNYFGKGDTTTYDRGGFHAVANPQDEFHTYTIDWTKDYVRWFINGNQVRELKYAEAQGGARFPQTPMQVKLGTWVAGRSDAPEGTVQWAGGKTDFSKAPFVAHYKSVTITDYSNGVKNAAKYVWNDGSDGSYQSIQVVTGDGTDGTSSSSSAQSSKTTATASATETSTATRTTLSTSATSASGTSSGTASGTVSGAASTSSGASGSSVPAETPTESGEAAPATSVPATAGALKMGFSGAALSACLFAVFML